MADPNESALSRLAGLCAVYDIQPDEFGSVEVTAGMVDRLIGQARDDGERIGRDQIGRELADAAGWPEWLTPEYSGLHRAIVNDMVRALAHCYASADAADQGNWTEAGWLSCSASAILSRIRKAGCPPTFGETEQLRTEDVHREWCDTEDFEEFEERERAAAEDLAKAVFFLRRLASISDPDDPHREEVRALADRIKAGVPE